MANSTRSLGLRLLGIWLVLYALLYSLDVVSFANQGLIMGLFALVVGVILIVSG